jgi:hypothetical protein
MNPLENMKIQLSTMDLDSWYEKCKKGNVSKEEG